MTRIILLFSIQVVVFFVLFNYVAAITVVTQPGKILGVAIVAAVSTLVQYLFTGKFLARYKFTSTLIAISATMAAIVSYLPGYTIVDGNKGLFLVVLYSTISIFTNMFIKK